MALLFWFILGRKKGGGTITFNIIMTLMLFSQFGQYSRSIQENNKSSEEILSAISEYKESSIEYPDSIDVNYTKFSSSLKGNIANLISNSRGEEKNRNTAQKIITTIFIARNNERRIGSAMRSMAHEDSKESAAQQFPSLRIDFLVRFASRQNEQ